MRHALLLILVATAASFGHGPQVQVTFNPTTNKIETRQVVSTDSAPTAISPLTRVYVMPLLPSGSEYFLRPDATRDPITGLPLHFSYPGLAYQYEQFLPGTGWAHSGSSTLPNLQGTVFSFAFSDGLKIWNGASFNDPGAEQLQMDRGGTVAAPAAIARTTDAGPFEILSLTAVGNTASSNPHSTVRWRILGDGIDSTSQSDDGVYLTSLRFTSTAAGVQPSDPFYFVMYKNVDQALAQQAAASLGFSPSQVQTYALVPEPTAASALVAMSVLTRRRRFVC